MILFNDHHAFAVKQLFDPLTYILETNTAGSGAGEANTGIDDRQPKQFAIAFSPQRDAAALDLGLKSVLDGVFYQRLQQH